jgi:alginate O-acetyltransferase complex protein AlgI
MVFASVEFLFLYLPAVLAAYFLVPARLKNWVLLAASLGFYIWGAGTLVFLLVASILANYVAGLLVAGALGRGNTRQARVFVVLAIALDVGLLAYFKYANFLVDQVNGITTRLGLGNVALAKVLLPIGISFYTFHAISYVIDVSRGHRYLRNLADFSVYITMFPQLIAGPIIRYHEIADQLHRRHHDMDRFAEGAVRFTHGLAKKVIVADAVAPVANAAFSTPSGELTFFAAWVGALAYTVQIYFDFSGYSDMAIGLGRMLGFDFPENFRRPYSSLSITDFWRRWHMTLSRWFRDYVYLPLGGSRAGEGSTYRNLVAVFLLTGVWHGANWTFIVWGAYHGALLLIERVTGQRVVEADGYSAVRRTVTFVLVVMGWVFFRADTLGYAFSYLGAMFGGNAGMTPDVALALSNRAVLTLAIGLGATLLPRRLTLGTFVTFTRGAPAAAARVGLLGIALPYATVLLAAGSFSPFLYFQF